MDGHGWQNFYGAVTVGERGQVVIPQGAREALGIKPGDKLLVLSGPLGNQGLMIVKAEAIGQFLANLTERMSSLEKLAKMAADQQDKDGGQ